MNNKIVGIILVAIVILGGTYFFMMSQRQEVIDDGSFNTGPNENMSAEGRVIFSVTDAAANMSTISEIDMKVSRVDVHSAAGGWMTVSTTPKTYSLLALNANGQSKLLADVEIEASVYDQIRLSVDEVIVKTKVGATKTAKLPSQELKINTRLLVSGDTTSSVNFDFLADKSLHITGNGEYIFAPVVKTETKSNASVGVDGSNTVIIAGGQVDDSNTFGMDIDGSVKLNFQIKSDQKINIDNNGVIKVEGFILP